MIRTALLTCGLLASAVVADAQHVPSLTVTGNEVTIDANFAVYNSNLQGVEIVQGTELSHPSVVASNNFTDPIILRMPPGTHEITAFGFPADPMQPERDEQTLTAVVEAPTRQQQINALYAKYLAARDEIIAMTPTTAEAVNALMAYARGGN